MVRDEYLRATLGYQDSMSPKLGIWINENPVDIQ